MYDSSSLILEIYNNIKFFFPWPMYVSTDLIVFNNHFPQT